MGGTDVLLDRLGRNLMRPAYTVGLFGYYYPIGRWIDAMDPTAGRRIVAMDSTVLPNVPTVRCQGTYFSMGRRIGAVDPTLPNGPTNRCSGSFCPMDRRMCVMDPTIQWAS